MAVSEVRSLHLWRAIERGLWIAGVLSLGWYGGVQISSGIAQASWSRELEAMADRRAAAVDRRGTAVASRVPVPSPGMLLGRIELPRVGVSAVVREGVDDRTLRYAVGHIPRTAQPGSLGNSAFAGHRDTFFRGLRRVHAGDRLIVTTPEGAFTYIVQDVRVTSPVDLSVLDPTPEPTLTLVTCYPLSLIGPAPKRFVVRATLAEVAPDRGPR